MSEAGESGTKRVSHAAWVASIEERERKRREQAERRARAEATKRAHKERAAAEEYGLWKVQKGLYDRALAALGRLSVERAETDEQYGALAVANNVVDLALVKALPRKPGGRARPTLFAPFLAWSRRHYAFRGVKVSQETSERLTRAARALLSRDPDDDGAFVYSSLRFVIPARPEKPGDLPKRLTEDERVRNELYMREFNASWARARSTAAHSINSRVAALSREKQRKDVAGPSSPDGAEAKVAGDEHTDAGAKVAGDTSVADGKAADLEDASGGGDGGGGGHGVHDAPEALSHSVSEYLARSTGPHEAAAVAALGLQQLLRWVEEDDAAREETARKEHADTMEERHRQHTSWVVVKNEQRIRMPPPRGKKPGGTWQPPRFDFSKRGVVRADKVKIPSNTVEMTRDWGYKYVHATKPQSGESQDLLRSRQALLRKGYVFKENFADVGEGGAIDREAMEAYRAELERNDARRRRAAVASTRKDRAEAKFSVWAAHSDVRAQTVALLRHIPVTADASIEEGNTDVEARWRAVGASLKLIDRTLLAEWTHWSEGFRSPSLCTVEWDAFNPIPCDVHTNASPARTLLLMLLHRRGVNWRKEWSKFWAENVRREEEAKEGESPAALLEEAAAACVTPRTLVRFLATHAVRVVKGDMRIILALFDKDNSGRVDMTAMLEFLGGKRRTLGDAEARLEGLCLWEGQCHVCGMANAYEILVGPSRSAQGDALHYKRVSLPFHEKEHRQYHHKARSDGPPRRCAVSQVTEEARAAELRKLEALARQQVEASRAGAWLAHCGVPLAPVFNAADPSKEVEQGTLFGDPRSPVLPKDYCTSLVLRWAAPPASPAVAFFELESSGPVGDTVGVWNRVLLDPPAGESDRGPRGWHRVTSLEPNTSYRFRLRGYNLRGAGPVTYGKFTTPPPQPPAPVLVNAAPDALTLSWDEDVDTLRYLKLLQRMFRDGRPSDAAGAVHGMSTRDDAVASRTELLGCSRELGVFLRGTVADPVTAKAVVAKATRGVSVDDVPLSVFDCIEMGDDDVISWSQLRLCFQVRQRALFGTLGEPESSPSSPRRSYGRPPASEVAMGANYGSIWSSSAGVTPRPATASAPQALPRRIGRTRFSLMQRMSGDGGGGAQAWTEVYVGLDTTRTIHGLQRGTAYAFRVQAANCDAVVGPVSATAVVHTTLVAPKVPCAVVQDVGEGEAANVDVRVTWEPYEFHAPASASTSVPSASVLSEWARPRSDAAETVSARGVFERVAGGGDRQVSRSDVLVILGELGVHLPQWRVPSVMMDLDPDQSERVSWDAFAAWWASPDVTYVLARDEGVPVSMSGLRPRVAGVDGDPDLPVTVVAYRGSSTSATVRGLGLNMMYRMRLRAVMSHESSCPSADLVVATPPARPSAVLISVTPKSARLRWYPGRGGSYKYVVEICHEEALPSRVRPTSAGGLGAMRVWRKEYEGKDCTACILDLLPNAVYYVRVRAVNEAMLMSKPSAECQIVTPRGGTAAEVTVANAESKFCIECRGDVVVGDTVLFTEDVFKGPGSSELVDVDEGDFACSRTIAAVVLRMSYFHKRGVRRSPPGAAASTDFLRGSMVVGGGAGGASVTGPGTDLRGSLTGRAVTPDEDAEVDLEVVWCRVSDRAHKAHKLARGTQTKRVLSTLLKWDMYRVPWDDEGGRWHSIEERRAWDKAQTSPRDL